MTATVLAPRVNSPQPGGPPVDKYTYGFAYQAVSGVVFVGHNGGTPCHPSPYVNGAECLPWPPYDFCGRPVAP
jgi:hypothetical protein